MALNLEKRNEKLTLSLTKKKIASVRAQVGTVFDRSGSMDPLYRDGTMQEYANRLVPIGLRFDDNGQIDNWAFHNEVFATGPISAENVETFVKSEIMSIPSRGTSYAPVLEVIAEHYFGTATPKPRGLFKSLFGGKTEETQKSTDPVYLIFQTDGDNDDKRETDAVLKKLNSQGIYIQFVGIGDETFRFIQEMGDKYDNVGFFKVDNLTKTTDETLYDLLINDEFKSFLKAKFPNNIKEI